MWRNENRGMVVRVTQIVGGYGNLLQTVWRGKRGLSAYPVNDLFAAICW